MSKKEMASKFLHSFTNDENPDLQKQIGCMTGIFQIFDRHHVLTVRHIHPKKLHQQQFGSHFSHDTIEAPPKGKIPNDKQQRVVVVSMESSQASFSSSSRSSSFSSIDYSRTAPPQPETAFSSRITPTTASSPQFSNHHQSLHLQDVVKDSILYRDVELSDWSSSSKSTWNLDETSGDVPRKSTTNIFAFPKDCPSRTSSYDLGENFKSTAPRLSLDSREGSLRSFKDSKPPLLINSKSQRESTSTDLVSTLQQTSTNQKRLPSVVAKLMGLEALPAASETQTMPSMKTSVSVSVVVEETTKTSKLTAQGSSRRRNNDVVVMKPITTSRLPIEPAPWKQIDGGRRNQRSKTTIRSGNTFPSVYGEIEKRMKDLEFTQAGKDLRALKQILEAMQTKGLLGTEIENDRKPNLKSRQVVNRSNSESSIVVMKPTKLVEKSMDRTKEQIQKTPRTNVRTPNPPQKLNSVKTSSPSISPRLQQKKLDLQKKSRPPTPPSDSNKSRRQTNSTPSPPPPESISSPGGKRRPKKHMVKLKKEEKSNHNPDSSTETEVTSSFRLAEKLDLEELCPITPDQQPSPVSVLDNSLYEDDEDSTTINRKKLENIELLVEKLKRLNSGHNETQTDYIASLCENKNPDHRYISEILLASGLILREEAFGFHPSGYPINPDLYLVLEQTKASNSNNNNYNLKGNEKVHRKFVFDTVNEILSVKLSSVWPHSVMSRHVKMVRSCLNGQKLLKELCFEIDKMQQKQIEANNRKKNMKEEGDELEEDSLKSILWEDVIDGTGEWTEFSKEIPEAVLDIERMVFKDLVDEVVRGEEPLVEGRFRRKLFVH